MLQDFRRSKIAPAPQGSRAGRQALANPVPAAPSFVAPPISCVSHSTDDASLVQGACVDAIPDPPACCF